MNLPARLRRLPAAIAFAAAFLATAARLTDYVDPRIGSEGLGRVFVGPATPFGMVRPGPDCTPAPNSGWLPMPERVDGFAQTHVSGTGGGPKYGNILIQPYIGDFGPTARHAHRKRETIECGYYATEFAENDIKVEITTAPRTSVYRISYPPTDGASRPSLLVDAGFFLGESPVPDAREAQQFVGSETEIRPANEITGYSRIRGGWNNGRAYTVYYCLQTDRPFVDAATWQGADISSLTARTDNGTKTGAMVAFAPGTDTVTVKVGISFVSVAKARQNLSAETLGKTFDSVRAEALDSWESLLKEISIGPDSPPALKRMFYTGLYHTMLMPSDRTGENPLWTDPGTPYYDDFYAIWDTYRTSMPLITLIDPERQAAIVSSLVNIGRRDGYMPDARSGNCNGRTQGGSNADIVVADAFVKHLPGIDYEAAYREMVKDAETDPGHDHEAHGRGGLDEYIRLGYVPYGIPRAGNRTVEYAVCDDALATVARGLGRTSDASRYARRSHNWRNLWRADCSHDGTSGFIMPRAADGQWLDSLEYGHSATRHPRYRYTPSTFEGPWHTPWWSMFFYEAPSWEYSLSMPHDVEALVEACGGADAFRRRLDTFFDNGHYNVNNEPSFLSPLLYHWIGLPDRSADRVREIVAANFGDGPDGLPGNDDSGAMSSWLAFHIMGLYPNAGHPYYLINPPMAERSTIANRGGKPFTVHADGLSDKNRYIASATLNGRPYPYSSIPHDSIVAGGTLRLKMGSRPSDWGRMLCATDSCEKASRRGAVRDLPARLPADRLSPAPDTEAVATDTVSVTYFLHGQKRRFKMVYSRLADGGMRADWTIERNLKLWHGSYTMSGKAVESGSRLSLLMPEDGNHVALADDETFGIVSRNALEQMKSTGRFTLDGVDYEVAGRTEGIIEAIDREEGCRLWILDRPDLPLVVKAADNPLEIDWEVSGVRR